jgi:hypothetical protein
MGAQRREKAQLQLLLWSPPALARQRVPDALPQASPAVAPSP